MTPYSCLMDDGTLLQVSAGSLSYAPNPKSRKSRLDAVINFCAALASLLLGLLFAYIGLVMFISFFRDNLDWWILPLSLCFGGFGIGVIDPAKVTRAALQNAASIAALLLTTEALVADKPDDGGGAAAAAMGGMGGMGGMM